MRLRTWVLFLAACGATSLIGAPACLAQQDQPESHRKMVDRIVPVYPALARKMSIAGSVKIEAVVAPNGTVKSAGILGGPPVLAQVGVDAVKRCKWETGSHETHEIVVLNFHPE
jgi:TonB family protein